MREGWFKQTAFTALELSGMLALAERLTRGLPILAYHGVTARPADDPANRRRLQVPRAEFERHLQLLARHHRPTPLGKVVEALDRGEVLPRGAVAVTFDDGYRNFVTQAWPLLRRYGVPVTLFVPTEEPGRLWEDQLEVLVARASAQRVEWQGGAFDLSLPADRTRLVELAEATSARGSADRQAILTELAARLEAQVPEADEDRDRLSWEEMRGLKAEGVDVGSHADRHLPLPQRPLEEAAEGLRRSLATLERELGSHRPAFSYPYGARSASLAAAVRAIGFSCAVTGVPALVRSGTDPYELPRILIGAADDRRRLRASLTGLRGLWQGDPWPVHGASVDHEP